MTSGLTSGSLTPEAYRLLSVFETENDNLSAIGSRLTETKMLATQTLSYVHIVNQALVPEKKAYPRRNLIVVVSAAATFSFFTFCDGHY